MLQGLYAITDAKLTPPATMLDQVEAALRGGAQIIQYRDKSDDCAKRLEQAGQLAALCRDYQRLLLINDDPELAKAVAADGVHLGQGDGSLQHARELLGPGAVIGITCHDSLELALQAQRQGADYVAFGAFFPSSSKPQAHPAPLSLLSEAHQQLKLPVVAIGGISMDNAGQLINAGADMIAVIQSLFAAPDIEQQAQGFNNLFHA